MSNTDSAHIVEEDIVPIALPGKSVGRINAVTSETPCNIYDDRNNEIDEEATALINELNRMTDRSNEMHDSQDDDDDGAETINFGNIFIKYPGAGNDCLDNGTVVNEEPTTFQVTATIIKPTLHENSNHNTDTTQHVKQSNKEEDNDITDSFSDAILSGYTKENGEDDTVNLTDQIQYFDWDTNTTDYIVIENKNESTTNLEEGVDCNETTFDNNNNDLVEEKECNNQITAFVVYAEEYDIPELPLKLHNESNYTNGVTLQSNGEVIITSSSRRQNNYNIYNNVVNSLKSFRSEANVNIISKEYNSPTLSSSISLLDLSKQEFTMSDAPGVLTRSSSLIELPSHAFVTKGRFVSATMRTTSPHGVKHTITKRKWCYVLRNANQTAAKKPTPQHNGVHRRRSCHISFTVIEDPATVNRWEITTFELLNRERERVFSDSEWVLIDCTNKEIELFNAYQNEYMVKHSRLLEYKKEEKADNKCIIS